MLLQQLLEVVRPLHSSLRHSPVRPWMPPPQARPPQTHRGTHLMLLPETVHGLLLSGESYLHPVMMCSPRSAWGLSPTTWRSALLTLT